MLQFNENQTGAPLKDDITSFSLYYKTIMYKPKIRSILQLANCLNSLVGSLTTDIYREQRK